MFCIIENNQVILGPVNWNQRRFQNVLLDDCEVTIDLPYSNDNTPIIVSDSIIICPLKEIVQPSLNSKIEQFAGPFLTVNDDNTATLTYQVIDQSVDNVKTDLKTIIAHNRWLLETNGITVNIQNTDVNITTMRQDRDIFLQALQLGSNNQAWKFDNNIWLTLPTSDLQTIVTAIVSHVQMSFDWESAKITEIDSCTDLSSLDSIVLKHQILIDKENLNGLPGYVN
jgi:hypothetical protein